MSYQLTTAKVWDGSAWVPAVGGGGASPWWQTDLDYVSGDQTSFENVAANASAHTKGAWTELIASTSADADVLILNTYVSIPGTNTAALVDIGIGAAGAEVAIIPNIAVGGADQSTARWFLILPVKIPAGSRVAARSQSVRTGGVNIPVRVALRVSPNYNDAPAALDVIGTSTATSEGVATVTDNTYVEITSASSQAYSAVVLVPSVTSVAVGNAFPLVDLATGASGLETVVASYRLRTTALESCYYLNTLGLLGYAAGPFPAGTRFAARTDAQAGNLDVCLVGIP